MRDRERNMKDVSLALSNYSQVKRKSRGRDCGTGLWRAPLAGDFCCCPALPFSVSFSTPSSSHRPSSLLLPLPLLSQLIAVYYPSIRAVFAPLLSSSQRSIASPPSHAKLSFGYVCPVLQCSQCFFRRYHPFPSLCIKMAVSIFPFP